MVDASSQRDLREASDLVILMTDGGYMARLYGDDMVNNGIMMIYPAWCFGTCFSMYWE